MAFRLPRRLRGSCLAAMASLLVLGAVAQAQAQDGCRPPSLTRDLRLERFGTALTGSGAGDILAIGSSSTEGVGASSRDLSYPAQLQVLLRRAMPWRGLHVANAGVGGETAPATLARLGREVAQGRYGLVLWQVGTNDAVRGGSLDGFRQQLREGIAAVRAAGAELVLIDQQFFPGIKDVAQYETYVATVAAVGEETRTPVFPRYRMMKAWAEANPAQLDEALSADRFHMSDAGYACLAQGLAQPIRQALGRETAVLPGAYPAP